MRILEDGKILCPVRVEGPNGIIGDGATARDAFKVASDDPWCAARLSEDEVAKLAQILGERWQAWRHIVNARTGGMPDKLGWPIHP
jgi:hypothetical protein